MARTYIIGIWATVAVIVGAWIASPAARSQQPAKEPRWEYKIVYGSSIARHGNPKIDDEKNASWSEAREKGLNKYANERWELVAVHGDGLTFYLRRTK